MKDEYKRRRKAEGDLIRTLPGVEPSRFHKPIHQEQLDANCVCVVSVSAQGNELIVISTEERGLEAFALGNEDNSALLNRDAMSGISEFSDDELIPSQSRTSVWHRNPRTSTGLGTIEFIARDVIGHIEEDSPGALSTWCARSSEFLERVTLRGVHLGRAMCKFSDTEFVIGSQEGHLCMFIHENGCNLQESARIWKAHSLRITFISLHKDTIVTTSLDYSARLWNAKSRQRLAVLNHDKEVYDAAISEKYIVTCSKYGRAVEKCELRIYRNGEGYPLIKILRGHEGFRKPVFVGVDRVLCVSFGPRDEYGLQLVWNSLVLVDIKSECVLAQLKVGCRTILDYTILADGRFVVVGFGGCRGAVVTFSSNINKLIAPIITKKWKFRRPRMCTLM